MKNVQFFAGAAVLALLCGCQHTRVDQVSPDQGMQEWYQVIRENYPGFRPPRLVSPGISGQAVKTAPKVKSAPADAPNEDASQTPAVDIAPTEIEAAPAPKADAPADAPAAPKTDAPAAAPAAPKVEAPGAAPAAPKADAPAVKADAPAPKAVEPPDPTTSQVYVVKSGDILSAISVKFYGSARYVNLIKKANSDILSNVDKLKPGMKLIIPKL